MALTANQGKDKEIMIEFKKNKENVWVENKKTVYLNVEFDYLQEFRLEAGEALFDSMVKHEMTYKEQYLKYEIEAYDVEINCLEDFYHNNC